MDYQWKNFKTAYMLDKFNYVKNSNFNYALLHINIKNFRFYNVKYGMDKGDEILELVFQTLRSYFSEEEYVGHIDSDNFAVLAMLDDEEYLTYSRMSELIDKLYRMEEPCIFRNIFFSVGIYRIENKKASFPESWNYADLARKSSKELHHRCTCIEVYDEKLQKEYIVRVELENKTADAYKNYEFVPYLQPKVELESETVIGAEALLRWFDKGGNSIPLYEFLPILNENGYIVLVDLDIFDKICAWMDERIKENRKVVPVSFNISKAYFYDPNILKDYVTIFEKYNIPKKYIQMEFMESISLNDTDHMKKVISGFKEYGFTCVLDDFGNGYSSFNVLLNAPLDIVKMDRQFFLNNLKCDGELVIKTIVDLIHSLKMKVVAEGVEQQEHIECLKKYNCEYVQGFYYYKPMPVDAFEHLLDKKE